MLKALGDENGDIGVEVGEDEMETFHQPTFVFWHVSSMCLSPYVPIVQTMVCKELAQGRVFLSDTEEVELEDPF